LTVWVNVGVDDDACNSSNSASNNSDCGLFQPTQAERRVALVIGNAAYRFVSALKNSTEDANRVTALLKQMDFDVTLDLDLDKIAMEATI
jgi:Caspase domain